MKHIRFDWAIKKILRDKANFVILEGFITELIGESITIESLLKSERNQVSEENKRLYTQKTSRTHATPKKL
ncbi:hypothetical protein VB711_19700 [Cronbergia sp. UHCC 0137]|uniref:hypothetical protein n=1 Tax=Cronbergia sp. UHCC 0137 TaxID=3110239 RepID=UPI002B20039B|nr:hypothetical protein [Cronbergia sp. UHCC 0137]MEA5620053.1 hypothetical protein [Cronbergia sp. UHCC 0137]